eukprot:SM000093S24433  [mRNA]  locus=s93:333194:333502:- [translate_table: standard]
MDALDSVAQPMKNFAKDSIRLVKRCHKPDRKGTSPTSSAGRRCDGLYQRHLSSSGRDLPLAASAEFTKVAFRTACGFVVMGFVGFFVKLIFIPINQIIVGSG